MRSSLGLSAIGSHEVGVAPVGVLALQGGFEAHAKVLAGLGARVREVRVPDDLAGLAGLVLPGGESTTMTLGIEREGLADPLLDFVRSGKPVLATCAGTILLDRGHLGAIDIECDRNAYGGQIHSFEADLEIEAGAEPFRGVFIRAPRIVELGAGVESVCALDGDPVIVRDGAVTALTFHPELTGDDRIHRRFLESVPAANTKDSKRKRRSHAA